MRDLAGDTDLVEQALQPVGVPGQRLGQELEGDGLIEIEVVGPIDLPHAAAAQEGDDPVAVADEPAPAQLAAARVRV